MRDTHSRDLLPTFLVIGAQKSGTTTLYHDLLTVPGIYLPHEKEPGNLACERVSTAAGRAEYAALYRDARSGQARGDASTDYAKLPDIGGVPERARQVCGPDLRIVYLVRNPVRRIISHHHHRYRKGLAGRDIAAEVAADPRYLAYSRYAMQLEPWLEVFDRRQTLVVRFESYVADRRGTVSRICEFLGVEPRVEGIRAAEVYNASGSERVATGGWQRLRRLGAYRRMVRPLLSADLRRRIRQRILPPPPPPPSPPGRATVEAFIGHLAADLERQPEVLGWPEPLWTRAELEAAGSA